MKKGLLIVALLLVSSFVLFGCGEKLEQGPKGPKGDQGAQGLSAYELAVQQHKTEEESASDWYDSLTGARGVQGTPGTPGENGKKGLQYELYVHEGVVYQRLAGSQEQGTAVVTVPAE